MLLRGLFILVITIFSFGCEQKDTYLISKLEKEIAKHHTKIDLLKSQLIIEKITDSKIDLKTYKEKIKSLSHEYKQLYTSSDRENLNTFLYDIKKFSYIDEKSPDYTTKSWKLSYYLNNKKGNCSSMPLLHFLIAKDLGFDVYLSHKPNHLFLKFKDKLGRLNNVEATAKGESYSNTYYKFFFSQKSNEKGIYLYPLNNKEVLSLLLTNLSLYYIQNGEYEKAIKINDLSIKNAPNLIITYKQKAFSLSRLYEIEMNKAKALGFYPNKKDILISKTIPLEHLKLRINRSIDNDLKTIQKDPKKLEESLEKLANNIIKADGLNKSVNIKLYDSSQIKKEDLQNRKVLNTEFTVDEFKGFYDPKTETVYINLSKINGSKKELGQVLSNELSHFVDHQKEKEFNASRQALSSRQESNFIKQSKGYISKEEIDSNFRDKIKSLDLSDNNSEALSVENPEPAYIAKRPLDGLPWSKKLSNSKDSILDNTNLELSHEQIFYEDELGGNIGFFSRDEGRVLADDPNLLSTYRVTEKGYDDAIMREAVKVVQPQRYRLCGPEKYNCQDWIDAVKEEYFKREEWKYRLFKR